MSVALTLFLIYVLFFITGAFVGSFINRVTCRLPLHIPIFKGRSFCPNCGKRLAFYDTIPLISFIWLGGQCRRCGTRIAPRYFLTELVGGIIAVVSVLRFGFNPEAAVSFLAAEALLAIGLSAKDNMRPAWPLLLFFVLPVALSGFAFMEPALQNRFIGVFAVAVPLFGLHFIMKDMIEKEDVFLIATGGWLLGWQGVVAAIVIAFILAILLLLLHVLRKQIDRPVQLTPCICVGIFLVLYLGTDLVSIYWQFLQ